MLMIVKYLKMNTDCFFACVHTEREKKYDNRFSINFSNCKRLYANLKFYKFFSFILFF